MARHSNGKQRIREALIDLMEEKPLNNITVSELAQKAGVSTTTYYYHYYRPDSVLQDILDNFVAQYETIMGKNKVIDVATADIAIELRSLFFNNGRVVKIILASDYRHLFIDSIIHVFIKTSSPYRYYAKRGEEIVPIDPYSGYFQYWLYSQAYAFVGRLVCWAQRSFAESPEELVAYEYDAISMITQRAVFDPLRKDKLI